MEEQQAQYERAVGTCNARGIGVGQLFSLIEHPVGDENAEYLVVEANYELDGGDLESGTPQTPLVYLLRADDAAQPGAVSPAAQDAEADRAGAADRDRRGPGGRGDLDRQATAA